MSLPPIPVTSPIPDEYLSLILSVSLTSAALSRAAPRWHKGLSRSSLEGSCDSSGGWAPRACAAASPAALPGSARATAPPEPGDQRPSRTSVPGRAEGGSAWSGLEGIRHPLARLLLRLPATPCLPPYCFPVVLAPVKAHSGFHKTEQRKVLKCREALGNTLTCLPPSTPKISASPRVFLPTKHPLSITLAHTTVQLSTTSCSLQSTALKWFRAPPRKAGGKVSGVSEPGFAADPLPCCCRCCAERGGQSWRLPAAVTTQPLLSYT